MANQKERAFTGVWIPKHIWLNDELSPIEKLFLAEIESLDNDEKRGCFASNEYFGNFFKISEGRAANIISGLRKRGYIIQVFFDGKVRGIRLHENVKAGFTPDGARLHENVKAGFTKRGKQVSRKREPYNKVENKVDNKEEEKGTSLSSSSPEKPNLEAEKEKPTPQVAPPPPPIIAEIKDPDMPGTTIYDLIPNRQYPTVEPQGEFKRVNIHEEIEAMRTDPAVLEGFVIGQKIAKDKFGEYLTAFQVDIAATGEKYASVKQLRRHFLNWSGCKREYEAKKKPQSKTYNGQTRSHINHAGGDLSKYKEKQIF